MKNRDASVSDGPDHLFPSSLRLFRLQKSSIHSDNMGLWRDIQNLIQREKARVTISSYHPLPCYQK